MNKQQNIQPLNSLQIELLKQFSYGLNRTEDLIAIKRLIADYLAKNIRDDVDSFWAENGHDEKILDEWLSEVS
ncbi:MAG: hypothetical protein KIT33_04910 [Candidatus Kapabacteria bacterium]|nr:hypothetical protein [Ignavibacteriota bacterium]MCW5884296.1 hypothetical protein [Candidatus Kapabacteria bacterium]